LDHTLIMNRCTWEMGTEGLGTVCRSQYGHRRHCKFFAADWRPSFLPGRTAVL